MKRDVSQLAGKQYDLLVIGGGIQGACVAWDATLRGLSVALIDQGDFGCATSANSLKIIHGGLRYLQDANLKLVRLMINERKALMQIAPHLVHPLPCLMPTYKQLLKSKVILGTALIINDLVGFDRNRASNRQNYLPGGRIISKEECLQLMPDIADKSLTGGVIWHDAQMYNSERMTLAFVLSAARQGANVANYVKAIQFHRNDDCITGIRAKDMLTGEELDIQAKLVVNTAGPWVEQLLKSLQAKDQSRRFYPSIAINLVTRQIVPEYAIGVPSKFQFSEGKAIPLKKSRILFITPWRNYSLIGTNHLPFEGCIDDHQATCSEIQDFMDEINTAYPGAALKREDVYFVHRGFLPAEDKGDGNGVKLIRQGRIYDHQKDQGLKGLITVVGVKYTMARHLAEQTVNLVVRKLGQKVRPCLTRITPIYGGQMDELEAFLSSAVEEHSNQLKVAENLPNLIYNYGSAYPQVLKYVEAELEGGETVSSIYPMMKAEILYSIREEMAQKLADILLRRTGLGSAGWPGEACVRLCAGIMAVQLGWAQSRVEQEINEVRASYGPIN